MQRHSASHHDQWTSSRPKVSIEISLESREPVLTLENKGRWRDVALVLGTAGPLGRNDGIRVLVLVEHLAGAVYDGLKVSHALKSGILDNFKKTILT